MTITVSNVSHAYGKTPVLHGVFTSFARGEFSAMIGPNGCGKSTLFNIISRVLPLQSGTITVNGKPTDDYNNKSLAQTLSVLPQSVHLPDHMTVHDMVMQGRYCYQSFLSRYSDDDLTIVENALKTMQVDHLAHKTVTQLSGGQVQRCRMAMVLAQESDTIMLDEPTAHLDLFHQYALLDTAKALVAQGKTVVAILHDMTQASLYADTITVLSNGTVHANGTPKQVMTASMMHDVFTLNAKNISKTNAPVYVPKHLS